MPEDTTYKDIQVQAVEKLTKELENIDEKEFFAEPVINYLIDRCRENTGLSEDVMQEHKTWNKCQIYIINNARKMAKGKNQIAIKNDTVYEWAEDYFYKDDKAEEEEKARKEKEQCEKIEKMKAEQKLKNTYNHGKKTSKPKTDTKKANDKKTENPKGDQICLFDL